MAEAWNDLEIDLIVADYFAMLIEELAGRPFNKSEHNRALQALLKDSARNRGSIEFKHQNISAVMLGLPASNAVPAQPCRIAPLACLRALPQSAACTLPML